MINKFLTSANIILEPLDAKHITEEYCSWLNDPEVTRFNSHGIFPHTLKSTKEYVETSQNQRQITLAIIDIKSKLHIGNISMYKIDFINSNADISIIIGNKNFWGKGVAAEAFTLTISHCFDRLNLHRVTAGTTADNIGMQKVLEKLNMKQEATLKDAIQRDDKYIDIYLYAILKNEFIKK